MNKISPVRKGVKPVSASECNARGIPFRRGHSGQWVEVGPYASTGRVIRRCKPCAYSAGRAATYGLTRDAYDQMVSDAGGVCACCGMPDKRLVVDHDHSTGAVRALICYGCNVAVGFMETRGNIVGEYLKRYI